MADLRESFPTLEDVTTKEGVNLGARIEGETPSNIKGSIGFSFKDSTGNVVLPQLNLDGSLPIAPPDNNCVHGNGKVAGVKDTPVDVATVVLALEKNYAAIEALVASTRTTVWSVVKIDDVGGAATETILLDGAIITGPGAYTYPVKLDCVDFNTIGGTGVQHLVLRGVLLEGGATDLHGFLGTRQLN